MRRYTLRILLCLFLGVVTTSGLSITLIYLIDPYDWVPGYGDGGFYLDSRGVNWYIIVLKQPAAVGVQTMQEWPKPSTPEIIEIERTEFGGLVISNPSVGSFSTMREDKGFFNSATIEKNPFPNWSRARRGETLRDSATTPDGEEEVAYERGWGWPLLSIRHEQVGTRAQEYAGTVLVYENLKPFDILDRAGFHFLWLGFLINTLFYAAIWFVMFFGIGATRRAIRRKRGRCPMCGYDLRGEFESGCSECGWNRTDREK